jgi:hypothetical protein
MIRYRCPHCGEDIEVADEKAGHDYACPACDRVSTVIGPALVEGITRTASHHEQHGRPQSASTTIVEPAGPSAADRAAGCGCLALDGCSGCLEGCFWMEFFSNCLGGCLTAALVPMGLLLLWGLSRR